MKIVIVFNHPYDGSYCNAILNSVRTGLLKASHEVDLIHLDKDDFDPVMRSKDLAAFARFKKDPSGSDAVLDEKVMDYKRRLEQADHLIFIFPIWWELMPAMTKGFIDKVIFPGVAYEYKPNGLMKKRFMNLKGLTLITTMNTHKLAYRLIFGNAIKRAFFTGTFWKMGYKNRKWINLSMVKFVSEERRKKWLMNIEERFARIG